jgi:hypothetical protein
MNQEHQVSFESLRQVAMSFPEVTEEPHFEKSSFRVKRKIFLTYDAFRGKACVKLSEKEQDIFVIADRKSIYPVPNKWGKQGWTMIELENVNRDLFAEAVLVAYLEVAPKNLADQVRSRG